MGFTTSILGLLVVSALVHATNPYGNYRAGGRYPYHRYNPYHNYNHHPCGGQQNCPAGYTLDSSTCRCVAKIDGGPKTPCGNPYPCAPGQIFDEKLCQCTCLQTINCPGYTSFNPKTCNCECPNRNPCPASYFYNSYNCRCEPIPLSPGVPALPPPPPLPPALPVTPQCPARARDRCLYLQILDPATCSCYCPSSAPSQCNSNEYLDTTACRCLPLGNNHNPSPPICTRECRNYQQLNPSTCQCECPARAQDNCRGLEVLDSSCDCSCPARLINRCRGNQIIDPNTCECTCGSRSTCNGFQVFDEVDCRCECRQLTLVRVIETPAEPRGPPEATLRPGTPRTRTVSVSFTPGGRRRRTRRTSRTPGGRRRGKRSADAELIEKRAVADLIANGANPHVIVKRRRGRGRSRRPGTRRTRRPGTRTTRRPGTPTLTFRPGRPGRPGNRQVFRQTIPGPNCPNGYRETINCECVAP